ncbi:hypothetical protein TanjilG_16261 [Lupinus angustifolius]|uniref:PIG-P domain-containing protein n=1 Tax=Lupinus angustifolius TaxID=3871 RepID=A0A1J7HRI1_LUPAN|nr:hypothetical protein TanjilG_16261 [Lupinus angustifolius]
MAAILFIYAAAVVVLTVAVVSGSPVTLTLERAFASNHGVELSHLKARDMFRHRRILQSSNGDLVLKDKIIVYDLAGQRVGWAKYDFQEELLVCQNNEGRATVSFLDPDDKNPGFGLSGDRGPKPSEVYGFVGSITTVSAIVIFLVWAYIPESWLQPTGVSYYPSRYWALVVPTYLMMTIVLAVVFYISLNFISMLPPASKYTVFDEFDADIFSDTDGLSRDRSSPDFSLDRDEKPIEPISDIGKILESNAVLDSIVPITHHENFNYPLPSHHLSRFTSKRFLDIYQFANKAAIQKERARIHDEMNRGLVTEMAELKQHGGKIAEANKVLIPAISATKFPDLEVNFSNGRTMKLPIRISDVVDVDKSSVPKASLVCLSFRANSQEMINSWSVPFVETFSKSEGVHLYQDLPYSIVTAVEFNHQVRDGLVSLIDSWLLSRYPLKRFLLWTMKKPNHDETKDTLQRQMVYSFGDHYYFRKELRILNTLTGYIFLLDNFGRVRWQGFGLATKDEVSSLISCTSLLMNE